MSWTIVGLGNPDNEYEGTRHNVGKDFVEALWDSVFFQDLDQFVDLILT